eukprot:m.224877 g.224877  ORF g.224877 m.224877 type:complete len:191 (+) comp11166_c0_seq1:1628-2200(+)
MMEPIVYTATPASEDVILKKAFSKGDFTLLEQLLCNGATRETPPPLLIDNLQNGEKIPWNMLNLGTTQQSPLNAPMITIAPPDDEPECVSSVSGVDGGESEGMAPSPMSTLDPDDGSSTQPTTPEPDNAVPSTSPRPKRKYNRRRPERADYASDEDFHAAYHAWRIHRDRNNKAVRKSRSHGTPRSKEQA